MSAKGKIAIAVIITVLVFVIGITVYFAGTTSGRKAWGGYQNNLQQATDEVDYKTRKQVEDTCRSMIASYKTDKMTYEMYKDSDDPVMKSSANQAHIRGNQTANTFNEYILKNSYVWKGNIPEDICTRLENF